MARYQHSAILSLVIEIDPSPNVDLLLFLIQLNGRIHLAAVGVLFARAQWIVLMLRFPHRCHNIRPELY